jgi:hypothetical protein
MIMPTSSAAPVFDQQPAKVFEMFEKCFDRPATFLDPHPGRDLSEWSA